jgi:glucosamine--fructose-6-phosphate aminotransferase (isomerizing)
MNIGPEYSVAATKSVIATIIILLIITGNDIHIHEIINDIELHIQKILHSTKIAKIVEDAKMCTYVIGDEWGYGVSREIALKIQEVMYTPCINVIGYEMKHGPLALIDNNSHVIYFGTSEDIPKILKSRGSRVIEIIHSSSIKDMLCSIITFQFVVYKIALSRQLPIDRPRNLAKSVTV